MNRFPHLISASLLAFVVGTASAANVLPQATRRFFERNNGSAAAVKLAALRYAILEHRRSELCRAGFGPGFSRPYVA